MNTFYGYMPASDSTNRKIGHAHVVYAPAANCPSTCGLKGAGCYAENAPLKWVWDKISSGEHKRSVTWAELLRALMKIARGEKVRLWVAGDFPTEKNGSVDIQKAFDLKRVLYGKRAWAYTHHVPNKKTVTWLGAIKLWAGDFTINVSVDNREDHVDELIGMGVPAVIALPSTETRRQYRTAGGNRIRICPQQIASDVTCEKCMLCHQRPRDMAIGFISHGTKKKTADLALTS